MLDKFFCVFLKYRNKTRIYLSSAQTFRIPQITKEGVALMFTLVCLTDDTLLCVVCHMICDVSRGNVEELSPFPLEI